MNLKERRLNIDDVSTLILCLWYFISTSSLLISCVFCIISVFVSIIFWANALKFFPENREIIYEYVGYVKLVSQIPWDEVNSQLPEPSGWRVKGTLKLQRIDDNSLAAAVSNHSYSSE